MSNKRAFCPLFDFQISNMVKKIKDNVVIFEKVGEHVFEKGFDIVENVKIRQIGSEDFERLRKFAAIDFWTLYPGIFSKLNLKTPKFYTNVKNMTYQKWE